MDSEIRGIPLSEDKLGALTLGGFIREVCQKHADREALVFYPPSGPVLRLSYNDVWREALAVARGLIARGVTKETRVGLLATNRPEWVTAMFGIALAGGTVVSMSTFATPSELDYQLRIGDVSILFFERQVLKRDFGAEIVQLCPELASAKAPVLSEKLPFLRRAICIGEEAPANNGAIETWSDFLASDWKAPASMVDKVADEIAPTDRGLVFFSSGSTARPKAIVHSHRAAAIQCWRWPWIFAAGPDVRTWAANGFFWSGNFTMALGMTLAAGGTLILQRYFDPGEALRLFEKERVSMPIAWPHQWAKLTDDPAYNEVDLSSLTYVGEISPLRNHPTVKSTWQEPTSAYGNTETLTLNCVHPSGTPPEIVQGNHGVPLPGNTIRIVDTVTGKVVPRGQPGEIAVKGPTLMLGYLRTAPEDIFDEEGFFHTGDGGFIDDQGRLHWQGRLNDIIKTGGANVSPLEIDAVLKDCPGVKLAATVGIPHETLGELVVACVVPEEGAKLDENTVRSFVSKQLSSYKVPRRVLFLEESEVSLTATNKVKTAPLRELAAKRLANA